MNSKPGDDMDKLKSKLQVYEDLLKEQAGEIAALKAEVAYLKRQQPQPTQGRPSTSAAGSSAQESQASGSRSTNVSVANGQDSSESPRSVAGSSQDPFVIDDEDEMEVLRPRFLASSLRCTDGNIATQCESKYRGGVPDGATSIGQHGTGRIKPIEGTTSAPLLPQQVQTAGHLRPSEDLPKKRRTSDGFPEYQPSAVSRPRKKPKLVVEVVIPPLSSAKRQAHSVRHAQPPPPMPGPNEKPQDSGYFDTGRDDDNDLSDMSSLTSLPSTSSRSPSPVPGGSGEGQAQPHVTHLLRSASRELSYYNPPVSPLRAKGPMPHAGTLSQAESSRQNERRGGREQWPQPSTYEARLEPLRRPLPPVPAPVGAAATRRRLTELASYTVTLSTPAIADIVVSRKQMSNIFGGSIMRMCVRTAGRDFIFPALNMNPFLPHAPGAPGLLFRSNDALPWKGDVQTVFVGLRQGEYRYCGQYRLRRADVLSAEEFSALSSKVKRKWADGLVKKPKFKDIRVRIATRRDHGREPTFQEIAAVVADRSDPFKGHISEQEIIGAYERGEERLLAWKMECIGFDDGFLKDLVSKL